MVQKSNILLAFYGDDFTGSTDALEMLCRAGAKAVLFIETPTVAQLAEYPGLNAFGVAGLTRSLPPGEMEEILIPAFEKIKATGAKHVHYKVCSTFDSSPEIGSIGKAIDCGAEIFENTYVPVLGGMPAFGRFCVFGNLFAKMGIGSEGKIYRLDRHPSMSKHPVTPMHESDLRIHLGKQTNKTIGLIDITMLKKDTEEWAVSEDIVLLDTVSETHLEKIGQWLTSGQTGKPLFSVGSSAVEKALGKSWCDQNIFTPVTTWENPGKAKPLLVVSGSCSPVTAQQIAFAKGNGFKEVIIDAVKICNGNEVGNDVIDAINQLLVQEENVIVHTGDKQLKNLSSQKLGTALGIIAKAAAEQQLVKRVVIAGGDTSSYAARAMEIEAVEMIAPVVIGAPLCKAHSGNEKIQGLEVNFKGGQVGSENYFEVLKNGGENH